MTVAISAATWRSGENEHDETHVQYWIRDLSTIVSLASTVSIAIGLTGLEWSGFGLSVALLVFITVLLGITAAQRTRDTIPLRMALAQDERNLEERETRAALLSASGVKARAWVVAAFYLLSTAVVVSLPPLALAMIAVVDGARDVVLDVWEWFLATDALLVLGTSFALSPQRRRQISLTGLALLGIWLTITVAPVLVGSGQRGWPAHYWLWASLMLVLAPLALSLTLVVPGRRGRFIGQAVFSVQARLSQDNIRLLQRAIQRHEQELRRRERARNA